MEQHPQDMAAAEAAGQAPDPTRRNFLKSAPLGALAVVTGTAGATEAPAAVAPAAAPGVKRGYHETEHIRRYYQTAAYW